MRYARARYRAITRVSCRCRRRCARRCERGSRTCPREHARRSTSRPCWGADSISSTCSPSPRDRTQICWTRSRCSCAGACYVRSPMAITTSATTNYARWPTGRSAVRGACCCIARSPKRWSTAAKASPTSATRGWPNTTSVRTCGARRCGTWRSPRKARRSCLRRATRCAGSTAPSSWPRSTPRQHRKTSSSTCTTGAGAHALRPD